MCAIFGSSASYCTSKNTASALTKLADTCTQTAECGKQAF